MEMKPQRQYISDDFQVKWANLEPIFQELLQRPIQSPEALQQWMLDRSEFEAVLQEDYAWRYIRMTCHTDNEEYVRDFQYFATEIEPQIAPLANELDKKLVDTPFLETLNSPIYQNYIRKLRTSLELFREENIPLQTHIQLEQQRYQGISGAMAIEWQGQEYTLVQASVFLKDTDRTVRENVWKRISARRLRDNDELDVLFDGLRDHRHQIAQNAGFENFRDYMFKSLGRFDYTVQDCLDFHEAIEHKVVPILQAEAAKRRAALKVDSLKPWDLDVDASGKPALKPFESGEELIDKTIVCFNRLDPYLGNCIREMKQRRLFDVESRKGKAPGGYNYPLAESGVPFIFMNSAGTFRDLTTMVHEGGHAVHTFISAHLELNEFKDTPSEVAELASMSMELLSMKHWDIFFEDEEDLKRAKREQLLDVLKTLPWVATIDAFQHWLYTHPQHTVEQRDQAWLEVFNRFGANFCDWDLEQDLLTTGQKLWQKQLHIFEVPFYYIEYGMAQLGAIALWKSFNENPDQVLQNYKEALTLGYTKTIPEIYRTAGIEFNFSAKQVGDLAAFVQQELTKLN